MKLIVIRHAEAVDAREFAKECPDDGLRPLTRSGQRSMRRAARGLREIAPAIDVLATSPYTRAIETADLISDAIGTPSVEIAELVPSRRPSGLLKWLTRQGEDATVAIVGHEPHLGQFTSWLLTGLDEGFITFKKGAACLLDFPDGVGAGKAKLLWMMTNRQLRRMRR